MKILATNDVHQMITKWKDLVKVCEREKPDVVAIAGDLFPKDTYILGQIPFMKSLKKYAKKMRNTGAEIVIILGNDDNQLLIPMMEEAEGEGLWHYLHEKICKINGYEFVGMPYVPDYPFGYKYWCHAEYHDRPRIDDEQFTDPVIINEETGEFEVIEDYESYLKGKKSISDSLSELADKVEDMRKSIWLIHAPPSSMGLDVCCHGAKVGSYAVLDFINRYSPFITIHGHIHESPKFSGKWYNKEGKTLCIQGGQIGLDLHYSILEIQDGNVLSLKHSIHS